MTGINKCLSIIIPVVNGFNYPIKDADQLIVSKLKIGCLKIKQNSSVNIYTVKGLNTVYQADGSREQVGVPSPSHVW